MYSILISLAIGALLGVGYTLLDWWQGWAMGLIVGVLAAVTCFIVLSRILAKRFEPRFLQAQKQLQSGSTQLAVSTLEDLLPLARWQVMLRGQIYAQLGILAYGMEDEKRAVEYLEKASYRAADAQMALAAILFRRKEQKRAFDVMEATIKANKKQILNYHAYAFMLNKSGQRDKAIEELQRGLKVEPSNESTKDNLLRLQNDRKLNMKRFGMQWYALRLEKPPASMRQYAPGTHRGMRSKVRKQKRRG